MSQYTLTGELYWQPTDGLPDESAAREVVSRAIGAPPDSVQIKAVAYPMSFVEATAAGDLTPYYLRAGYPSIEFAATWRTE